MTLTFTAAEKDDGRKVFNILRGDLMISATLLRRMKRCGTIKVDGNDVFTDYRIKCGETLTADVSLAEPESDIVPETGEVDILYENSGLVVINKPAGIIVHPSHAKYTGTLSNFVSGYLMAKGEVPVCHAVNRLDRDTSGVVLFAKNTYMKSVLSDSMANAEKTYLALCFGVLPESGTIDAPIRRESELEMKRIVTPDGQRAVTHYRRIGNHGGYSLAELRLETGRTHQIRVHLSHIGCPILGDRLYGTVESLALSSALSVDTQALHAARLRFYDPLSRELITIDAPITRGEFSVCEDDIIQYEAAAHHPRP
ncbi:MAG: RluA family pseudouridine synthase [Oscillospiraceae bacterium]|nr:RluA family pseudouridine synthase [Oscillospiraceae bacterium]